MLGDINVLQICFNKQQPLYRCQFTFPKILTLTQFCSKNNFANASQSSMYVWPVGFPHIPQVFFLFLNKLDGNVVRHIYLLPKIIGAGLFMKVHVSWIAIQNLFVDFDGVFIICLHLGEWTESEYCSCPLCLPSNVASVSWNISHIPTLNHFV